MHSLWPWLALMLSWVGNCGFWLFCFNRVNAFGYPRPIAKLGEKVCISLCFLIPGLVLWWCWPSVSLWLRGAQFWPEAAPMAFRWWLAFSWACLMVLGPLWLESRRWLIPPKHLVETQSQLYNVHQHIPGGSAANLSTRCWSLLPLNEWAHLEVTQKTIQLYRDLPACHAFKIGHLSDLHFTGQYSEDHYHFVVDRMMELEADLIAISGDIIDFQDFLPLVDSVLGRLSAPLGVYYVLGNHDRRLRDINPLVSALEQIGLYDLGTRDYRLQHRGLPILLTGDESPWFRRRLEGSAGTAENQSAWVDASFDGLRLAVAHTPDRIGWARQRQIDLLLAGHTHGGQARFPLVGPLVAPSLYGSKFASGLFALPPTVMHVSRGVAGTHTIRWRCPPEISLLTLANCQPKRTR